jgi:hypothetical protein
MVIVGHKIFFNRTPTYNKQDTSAIRRKRNRWGTSPLREESGSHVREPFSAHNVCLPIKVCWLNFGKMGLPRNKLISHLSELTFTWGVNDERAKDLCYVAGKPGISSGRNRELILV